MRLPWIREWDRLKVLTFLTMAASIALVAFVWDLWGKFDTKSQALARNGPTDAAEYMRISTTVLGTWILPTLVVVSVLALSAFVISLRRRQPAPA